MKRLMDVSEAREVCKGRVNLCGLCLSLWEIDVRLRIIKIALFVLFRDRDGGGGSDNLPLSFLYLTFRCIAAHEHVRFLQYKYGRCNSSRKVGNWRRTVPTVFLSL
ncbi:hypothetical protein EVAR_75904_1 [Eumeta japonica]|uniref:Uncharacterized protein n=1 Tax=Eumeta variegata TaxID=151549 RepID=A0A4C1UW15_EUMVA|nr:hypothetical protein EVAR_75904_1 [Eumeta japonica]